MIQPSFHLARAATNRMQMLALSQRSTNISRIKRKGASKMTMLKSRSKFRTTKCLGAVRATSNISRLKRILGGSKMKSQARPVTDLSIMEVASQV